MKLKTKQPRYKLPPYSEVLAVYIEGNQRHNQMHDIMLPMLPIDQLGGDVTKSGRPERCGVYAGFIEFTPKPDKPYAVKVRYVPPIAEF